MERCARCGAALFSVVEQSTCNACPNNGVWDDVTCVYVYPDPLPAGCVRDQCDQEWACRLGGNFNAGCRFMTCAVCGYVDFLPNVGEAS